MGLADEEQACLDDGLNNLSMAPASFIALGPDAFATL
jgi:hypothetical protein